MVSYGCQGLTNYAGNFVWCNGATQAYDAIDQKIPTTVGATYTVSFYLNQIQENPYDPPIFQPLATDGTPPCASCAPGTSGNGLDILVYIGAAIPPPGTVPEPSSLLLLATGVAGLAGTCKRKFGR